MSLWVSVARLAVAATLLAALGAPIGVATAQSNPRSVPRILREARAFKAKNAALLAALQELQAKAAALEEREPAVVPRPGGAAGGDLAGAFPNPSLGAGTVFGGNVLDGSLIGSDFGTGSIQPSDLADQALGSAAVANFGIGQAKLFGGSVGGPQLGPVRAVRSAAESIGPNRAAVNSVACEPNEKLIGGGTEWESDTVGSFPGSLFTTKSAPNISDAGRWDASGFNGTGSLAFFFAVALCLKVG